MDSDHKNASSIDHKALLRSAPDLYLILTPQLVIVEASDAYLNATMVRRDEIIGRYIFDVFPSNPDDLTGDGVSNLSISLEKVLKNKVPDKMATQKYDIRRPTSEGGKFEVRYWSPINTPVLDDSHELKYIIHRVEDVTEVVQLQNFLSEQRKGIDEIRLQVGKTERELLDKKQEMQVIQETNEKLRAANAALIRNELSMSNTSASLEYMDDVIIVKSLDGIIKSWNGGAERLYGYKASEVIGKSIAIIIPDNRIEEHLNEMQGIRQGTLRYVETERKNKAGDVITISSIISPVRSKNGEIIGACSVSRDISEWTRINKMQNEFISMISHELRTPLSSILGSLSLLLDGSVVDTAEKENSLLKIAKQNCERLMRLVNDILDIERIESGRFKFNLQPVKMGVLLKELVRTNQVCADAVNIKITLHEEGDSYVNADYDRLSQVINNLISNAIKFSDSGSEIKIAKIEKDNRVIVSVHNDGSSIPKEFQSQIFTRFAQSNTTAARKQSGTGLGLNICKKIIDRLKGVIYFETDQDKGTTFYFELPILNETERERERKDINNNSRV